jgi:hypothetical protein
MPASGQDGATATKNAPADATTSDNASKITKCGWSISRFIGHTDLDARNGIWIASLAEKPHAPDEAAANFGLVAHGISQLHVDGTSAQRCAWGAA